jgi:hypothetical protein
MMSLWDALRMNMMISYQELVRTFPNEAEVILPGKIKHRDRHRAVLLSAISSGQENRERYISLTTALSAVAKRSIWRFSTSAITEGTYSLDVYTNDEWKGATIYASRAIKMVGWASATPKRCWPNMASRRKSSIRS